jgi:hypothetical protein
MLSLKTIISQSLLATDYNHETKNEQREDRFDFVLAMIQDIMKIKYCDSYQFHMPLELRMNISIIRNYYITIITYY